MGCLWNTLRCLPFPTCIVHLITCYKVVHGLVSVSRSGKTKARNVSVTRQKAENCDALEFSVRLNGETSTGVNPAGDAGDTSPNILVGGTSTAISPPILLRTFGYSRPILVALRSLSFKPLSFGYKTPPIRFSQAGGQSAHKARPVVPQP